MYVYSKNRVYVSILILNNIYPIQECLNFVCNTLAEATYELFCRWIHEEVHPQ